MKKIENLRKETEVMKKKQIEIIEWKNTIEIKNSLYGLMWR